MKKVISVVLSAVILLNVLITSQFSVLAANITINSQDVTLYALNSGYDGYVSIPNNFTKSFQIKVSGASSVKYKVLSGDSATVDDKGLVTPKATIIYYYDGYSTNVKDDSKVPKKTVTTYKYDETVVRVTADSKIFDVKVRVKDYASYYAEKVMDDYIAANVTDDMTNYEKIEQSAVFAASFDYSSSYSDAVNMIIFGSGDCWASTAVVTTMCKKMGFDSWGVNASKLVSGFEGNNHRFAMVETSDGTLYSVDAGYVDTAPRPYNVSKLTSPYSCGNHGDGVIVCAYFGKSVENLVIPNQINGKDVVAIDEEFISSSKIKSITIPSTVKSIGNAAFSSCTALETINLPSSLTDFGVRVFSGCNKLTNIKNESKNFYVSSGAIYNAEKTELISAPAVSKLNVLPTVKTINGYSCHYNNNLTSVTIPESVSVIGEGAFGDCNYLNSVTIQGNGLTEIDNFAFTYCTSLRELTLPASVTTFGNNIFLNAGYGLILYGPENGPAQKYAEDNNIMYNHYHSYNDGVVKEKANCIKTGVIEYTCQTCGMTKRETIPVTNTHNYNSGIYTRYPTCTEEGIKTYTCRYCKKEKTEIIPASGHIFNDSVVTKNPTCASEGVITYICAYCDETKTQTMPKTTHTYKTTTTKATTKKNGSIVTKCSACGNIKSSTAIYYPKKITLSATSYTYNGKVKKPSVTVKDSSGKIISAGNYTVTYSSGRKNAGIYTVTIKFKGNYSGTVKKTFTIKPKATSISKLKAKVKGFTVSWKKQTTQSTGYQIQYSTSSKFNSAKTVTVGKNSTSSKTVSKLSANKKYYVRVRTYKTVKVNGKNTKIYSSWSKAKSVTTLKMGIVSTKTSKYTYKQMTKDIKELKQEYPELVTYRSLGKTADSRNIYEITVGNRNAKDQVIIQATMHAREYINSLLVMRQAESLCANNYTESSYNGIKYSEFLDKVCFHIVPMVNPDGVTISQYGANGINNKKLRQNIINMCKKYGESKKSYYTRWKANAKGVDLNKNYPQNWGSAAKSITKPCSEGYKGSSAGSEKESKIMMNLVQSVKPKTVISYHSTGSVIYWNFNQKGKLQKDCKSLFNVVKGLTGYVDAEPNLSKKAKIGPSFGGWVCAKKKIPTLTIETGKNACPIQINEFKSIWNKHKNILPEIALWCAEN